MTARSVLDAGGYRVTFAFQEGGARGYLDALIEFSLPGELGGTTFRARPTFLALRDLQRLADYLDAHLRALRDEPSYDSDAFVPQELGFQLQALSGELDPDGEGEFTLRFLLNVGEAPVTGARVYVGAESAIAAEGVREFIASLRGIAHAVPQGR